MFLARPGYAGASEPGCSWTTAWSSTFGAQGARSSRCLGDRPKERQSAVYEKSAFPGPTWTCGPPSWPRRDVSLRKVSIALRKTPPSVSLTRLHRSTGVWAPLFWLSILKVLSDCAAARMLAGNAAFEAQAIRLNATRLATDDPAEVATFASKFLSESDAALDMAMAGLSAKQLLNSLQLGICVIAARLRLCCRHTVLTLSPQPKPL